MNNYRSKKFLAMSIIINIILGCGSSSKSHDNNDQNITHEKTDTNITQKHTDLNNTQNNTEHNNSKEDIDVDLNTTEEKVDTNKSSVFNMSQKDFLYDLFKTEYLWYAEIEDKNYTNYKTPRQMIENLRYSTYDKWSFSITFQQYEDMVNQETEGFGCYVIRSVIYKIEYNSPCDLSGLKRGDIVQKINNKKLSSNVFYEAADNLGKKSIFTVQRGDEIINIEITPNKYSFKSSKAQILTNKDDTKTGHMILNEFTETSAQEIDEIFTYFLENNITELVVDLRYNGGGSIVTESILMDKIAGYTNDGSIQVCSIWNKNYTANNYCQYFEKDNNSIDLKRVFFLTTAYTASASEAVISGLKPYMDVKVIGTKTHGKPVGMRGRIKGNFIYFLINYQIYNSSDEGDYFDGIDPDCYAYNYLNTERTDVNDNLLREALYYIDNNSCIDN